MLHAKRWLVLAFLAGGLLAIPAVAFAGSLFDDVKDSSVHFDGIEFMKNSGVTVGCGGNDFCPQDKVSREQMGTFMYRLSGNDPGTPPSVNATSVDGIDSAGLTRAVHIGFADGETVTLASDGNINLTAVCGLGVGGADTIDYFWQTTAEGATGTGSVPVAVGPPTSLFGPTVIAPVPGTLTYGFLVTGFSLIGNGSGDSVTFLGSQVGVNVGGSDCVVQGIAIVSPAA